MFHTFPPNFARKMQIEQYYGEGMKRSKVQICLEPTAGPNIQFSLFFPPKDRSLPYSTESGSEFAIWKISFGENPSIFRDFPKKSRFSWRFPLDVGDFPHGFPTFSNHWVLFPSATLTGGANLAGAFDTQNQDALGLGALRAWLESLGILG